MHESQTETGREDWPEDYAAPPIPADVRLPPSEGASRPNDGDVEEFGGSRLGDYQGGVNDCE